MATFRVADARTFLFKGSADLLIGSIYVAIGLLYQRHFEHGPVSFG
jgi:hypothetical protein